MSKGNKYFKLFANCIPVRGASRSVICDLQRRRVDFIPNSLLDILEENKGKTLQEIKDQYGKENEAILNDYFNYLIQKDYLFLCDQDELDFFPDLNLSWESPSLIENAIIDIDHSSNHDYPDILSQLEALGCVALHLRFFTALSINILEEIFAHLSNSRFESLDLLLPYSNELTANQLNSWANQHPRLRSIVIHHAPAEKQFDFQHPFLTIIWSDQTIDSHAYCGIIGPKHFTVHQQLFSESQQFNTCLNHKLSINTKGDIKNCPSMPEYFGNAKDTKLADALLQKDFKKYWGINKDQIDTCKVCEFRHICTDCRAFLEKPDDRYSKPLKCGYDPETNEWSDWSTNPLKEKAIKHYELSETLIIAKSI